VRGLTDEERVYLAKCAPCPGHPECDSIPMDTDDDDIIRGRLITRGLVVIVYCSGPHICAHSVCAHSVRTAAGDLALECDRVARGRVFS
jgi:hypothetical protein